MPAIPSALTLVHHAPLHSGTAQHLSIFRHWIEQAERAMQALEAGMEANDAKHNARYKQLRRRFLKVVNEAYLCCAQMENTAGDMSASDKAATRIPRLMWLMIRIRRQAERLAG
jgi:hypothetical protein